MRRARVVGCVVRQSEAVAPCWATIPKASVGVTGAVIVSDLGASGLTLFRSSRAPYIHTNYTTLCRRQHSRLYRITRGERHARGTRGACRYHPLPTVPTVTPPVPVVRGRRLSYCPDPRCSSEAVVVQSGHPPTSVHGSDALHPPPFARFGHPFRVLDLAAAQSLP